jgi:hypothetical protein
VEEDPDASVVPLINVWPGRTSVDYERYIRPFTTLEPGLDEILRDDEAGPAASIPLSADVVAQVAQSLPGETTYVVATGSMRGYDAYYENYVPGDYEATLEQLASSPEWEVVRQQDDLRVFRYLGPATPSA